MVFAVLLAGVFSLFNLVKFKYWDNIYALLFLNGTALQISSCNIGVAWYCSAMMFHFILFYYLLSNFNPKTVWLIIALGIYLSYSILLQAKHFKINAPDQTFYYIYNVGMMRAWGGIGIGMFIGRWYKTFEEIITKYTPSPHMKFSISTLEFVCLYFMINNLMLHRFKHFNHFMFIIVFSLLISLFICNKGYISQLFNKDIFPKISRYIYSIFITHPLIITSMKNGVWKPHREWVESFPITNILLTIALIFILGILTYHFVEIPAKNYLTKLFFKKN